MLTKSRRALSRNFRVLILIVVSFLPGLSFAQDFPSRQIGLVVPFPPGGPTDIIARLLGQALSDQLGKPVVVLNVGGAGGTIGAARVATAPPDGYTLLMASSAQLVLAPHVFPSLPYNGYDAFEPVGLVTRVPLVLQVPAASKYKSLKELLDYGKANPGAIKIANVGLGTIQHVVIELLLSNVGINAKQIPYKGSAPATTAFLGGDVDFMIDLPGAVAPLVEGSQSRALAVFSNERIAELPNVPTAREQGVDFEAYTWFSVMAPKGISPERLALLRDRLTQVLANNDMVAKMKATGFPATPMPIADFTAMMKAESARYKTAVDAAGIKIQ